MSLRWFLAFLALCAGGVMPLSAAEPEHRVLLINSYHPGLPWSDGITAALQRHIAPGVEIYAEYLDSKRFPEIAHQTRFLDYLQTKFANTPIDAVMVSDDAAYRLVRQRPIPLLREMPIVFAGVNEFVPGEIQSGDPLTGIVEITEIEDTLDLAHHLHPNAERIIVISDNTLNGRANLQRIRRHVERRGWTDRVVYPNARGTATAESYRTAIRAAPRNTIVYAADFYVESDGTPALLEDLITEILAIREVPIYGHLDTIIGSGAIGGKLVRSSDQGRVAAGILTRIFAGESAAEIPVVTEKRAGYLFDARELRRYGISRRSLPEGSVVTNTLVDRVDDLRRLVSVAVPVTLLVFVVFVALMIVAVVRIRAARALTHERDLFQSLLDESPDLIFFKDMEGRFLRTNRAHDRHIGLAPGESCVGRTDFDFYPEVLAREQQTLEQRIIESGTPLKDNLEYQVGADGSERWMLASKMPYRSADGRIVGIVGLSREVTTEIRARNELEAALDEREILLKEIHHRIKNNMQLISSVLSLQKGSVSDEHVRSALNEAQVRVQSMAMVHEHLYQGTSVSRLDLGNYLRAIFDYVLGFARTGLRIEPVFRADPIPVELETAIHLGLIASEMLSNAVKHAFPEASSGEVELSVLRMDGSIRLTVRDNGVGIDPDRHPAESGSMGTQIVTVLARQLGGTFQMRRDDGTVSEFRMPWSDVEPS